MKRTRKTVTSRKARSNVKADTKTTTEKLADFLDQHTECGEIANHSELLFGGSKLMCSACGAVVDTKLVLQESVRLYKAVDSHNAIVRAFSYYNDLGVDIPDVLWEAAEELKDECVRIVRSADRNETSKPESVTTPMTAVQ